jgi:hypothetical protein
MTPLWVCEIYINNFMKMQRRKSQHSQVHSIVASGFLRVGSFKVSQSFRTKFRGPNIVQIGPFLNVGKFLKNNIIKWGHIHKTIICNNSYDCLKGQNQNAQMSPSQLNDDFKGQISPPIETFLMCLERSFQRL